MSNSDVGVTAETKTEEAKGPAGSKEADSERSAPRKNQANAGGQPQNDTEAPPKPRKAAARKRRATRVKEEVAPVHIADEEPAATNGTKKPGMTGSVESDFDLDAMAARGNLGQLLDGTSTERPVSLGKPPKTSWLQVDHLKVYDTFLVRDADNRDAIYVCPPDLRAELESDAYLARLYLSVTRSGSVFLIPVRMPSGTRELDTWSKSAHEAFARYRAQWIRLIPNMEQGCYVVRTAPAITDQPSWPEEELRELLKRTLRDRVLNVEHPLVKRLRGEA